MVVVLLIALIGIGIAAGLVALARAMRGELTRLGTDTRSQLEQRNADVDRRLQGVIETMDRRLGELVTKVDRPLAAGTYIAMQIDDELRHATQGSAVAIACTQDLFRFSEAHRPP